MPRSRFSSWWTLLALVCASTIAVALLAGYLRTNGHWAERLGALASSASIMYMLAGVISAAAAVLLTGVIVMAPLLSLALHQSHDPMFDLIQRLEDKHPGEEAAEKLKLEILQKLRDDFSIYATWNPIYFTLWISSVVLLGFFTFRLLYLPSIQMDMFRDAMLFLALSCVLCVLFAIVAVIFFAAVRPGITKLTFYTSYFNMTNGSANPITASWVRRHRRSLQILASAVTVSIAIYIGVLILRPSKSTQLIVAINSTAIATSPVFVASQDFATGVGLDLDIRSNASGRAALDALIGGSADVATAAEFPVLLASQTYPELRIVQVLTESNLIIVARRSRGISSIADLRGKRIAVLDGASPLYFVSRALQDHGVPLSSVHFENVDPPNMVSALQRGDVDAISIWEPLASQALAAVGTDGVEFQDSAAYVEHFCLVTTTSILNNKAKASALVRLVQTIQHVSQHLNTDSPPDDAIDLISQRTNIAPNTLRAVWDNFHFPASLDPSLTETLRSIEDWRAATDHKSARSSAELAGLVDHDIEHAGR